MDNDDLTIDEHFHEKLKYYLKNVTNCSSTSIRDSIVGEESICNKLSVLEYESNRTLSDEIRELMIEINSIIRSN